MVSSTCFQVQDQRLEFRYNVLTTRDALRIRLEDRQSKEQWQTKLLTLSEFTTSDNMLAKASITDYANQFDVCIGGSDTSSKDLSAENENGVRVLVLRLPLEVSTYTTTLVYEFQLEKIQMDLVDELAASVRETKDAIDKFRDDIASLHDQVDENETRLLEIMGGRNSQEVTQDQMNDMAARIARMDGAITAIQHSLRAPPRRAPFDHRPTLQPRQRTAERSSPVPDPESSTMEWLEVITTITKTTFGIFERWLIAPSADAEAQTSNETPRSRSRRAVVFLWVLVSFAMTVVACLTIHQHGFGVALQQFGGVLWGLARLAWRKP